MKNEIIDKLSSLSTAAFGLVAALAWNGAIRAAFDYYYATGEGLGALFAYAIIVTLVAVIVTLVIARIADRTKQVNIREKIKLEKLKAIRLKRKE